MDFREERGIGYCGLACVLCSDKDCPGCAAGIADGGDCSVGKCAVGKGIDGCYACEEYDSCTEGMPHGKRSRAFIRYEKEFGGRALIDRLRVNYQNGITYHRPDKLPGDYDRCETEQEIFDLLKNGKPDPYDKCPEYESGRFRLRLVSMDDAEDLFLCYSDKESQKLFNSDNCLGDFIFSAPEHMEVCLDAWLHAYKNRDFIRYAIIDKKINKAIGTAEIFGGERGGKRTDYSVLRIDVRSEYENEASLAEILKISDSFFFDVNTGMFITKAIPEAASRIAALVKNGYTPTPTGDGGNREHYYMKRSPV